MKRKGVLKIIQPPAKNLYLKIKEQMTLQVSPLILLFRFQFLKPKKLNRAVYLSILCLLDQPKVLKSEELPGKLL